jgi:protein-tyrosine-phosphatase
VSWWFYYVIIEIKNYIDYPVLRIWDAPDPYGGSAEQYRQAADLIITQVNDLVLNIS